MPCYQVRTVSVKFSVKHVSLLERAAKKLNLNFEQCGRLCRVGPIIVDLEKGEATVTEQGLLNQLKVAYSKEAIAMVARQFNWSMQNTGNQFVLRKAKWS